MESTIDNYTWDGKAGGSRQKTRDKRQETREPFCVCRPPGPLLFNGTGTLSFLPSSVPPYLSKGITAHGSKIGNYLAGEGFMDLHHIHVRQRQARRRQDLGREGGREGM